MLATLDRNPAKRSVDTSIAIGDVLTFPGHQLRVLSLDFVRDPYFPDAAAEVVIESGNAYDIGTHIKTPFGFLRVAGDDR